MQVRRQYGTAGTVSVTLWALDGETAINPALVVGDVQVSIDGGVFANIATLPTYVENLLVVSYSAAEATGKQVTIRIADQDGPLWAEQFIHIETEANPAAQWAGDQANLDAAVSSRAAPSDLANLDVAVSSRATVSGVQALLDTTTYPEVSSVPGQNATIAEMLSVLKVLANNKMTVDENTNILTVFAGDGVTPLWTRDLSDENGVFTTAPAA